MSSTKNREGTGKTHDICIFENQIKPQFLSVLKDWKSKGEIAGYIIANHTKDHYNLIDEKEQKGRVKEGEQKPSHYHIAVCFKEQKNTKEVVKS